MDALSFSAFGKKYCRIILIFRKLYLLTYRKKHESLRLRAFDLMSGNPVNVIKHTSFWDLSQQTHVKRTTFVVLNEMYAALT